VPASTTAAAPMLGVRLGFAVFGGFWGTWAVATLDIQEFLGLSDSGLGALVAATVIGTSVANVAGGALAERHGADRASAAALAIWGALLLAAAAVPWPGPWMGLFLLVVAAGGLLDVVLNIASTGALQDRPGPLLRVHASYNLGTIAGAGATGVAVAALGTWRWSMLGVGVGAVGLATLVRTGRVTIPEVTSRSETAIGEALSELRRSGLLPLAAVFTLGAMVEGGIGTFGVLYLRDRLDVAVLAGAGAYVLGQALATTSRFAAGSAAAGRHLGGPGPARLGLAVAGAGLALEVATDQPVVAGIGLAIASIGVATYWPLLSAVATRASDRPGLAVGGVSAFGYLGFLAGPPIVGAVADGASLRVGVLVLAAAGGVAASIPLRGLARRLLA